MISQPKSKRMLRLPNVGKAAFTKNSVSAPGIMAFNWIFEIGERNFIDWRESNFETKLIM